MAILHQLAEQPTAKTKTMLPYSRFIVCWFTLFIFPYLDHKMDRHSHLGLRHHRRHLCHLSQPHHGKMHWMPGSGYSGEWFEMKQLNFREQLALAQRSARWPLVIASMPSTAIASNVGSKLVRFVRLANLIQLKFLNLGLPIVQHRMEIREMRRMRLSR